MSKEVNYSPCAYPWQQMIIDLTGEVVPCCFWSGYGNTGKPLGNTNQQSIAEIWNSENYRDLRKRVASGDLEDHPCGNCMSYRWANNQFPKFSWSVCFTHELGYCYFGRISESFLKKTCQLTEPVLLFEDGVPLEYQQASHEDIRKTGLGRYSIWEGWLYFSTSDNSEPHLNGKKYELRCGSLTLNLSQFEINSPSGQNLLKAYAEYKSGTETMQAKPTMLSLISTADCNIDCPGCSQNRVRIAQVQHRPETVPDALTYVPYLTQFIWHGGEPYLIKKFRSFINEFSTDMNPNLAFGFTSNGTMITSTEVEKLKKFPKINLSISIDSFNKETFEKIRTGAKFERVISHLLNLFEIHNAPEYIISVGMIICKSNIHELPDNLKTAIHHGIGINLSPVVLYPVIEQLNVFQDFFEQSKLWQHALDEAASIIAEAKKENKDSIKNIDPSCMIAELQSILEKQRQRYSSYRIIEVEITDPNNYLANMPWPGIVFYTTDHSKTIAYLELNKGAGVYILPLPSNEIDDGLKWLLHPDLIHNISALHIDLLTNDKIKLNIPSFQNSCKKIRNIELANYGDSTPDGLYVINILDINKAYLDNKKRMDTLKSKSR